MYRTKVLAVSAAVCLGASIALACGPDFPWQLLTDREATLNTMPFSNSFEYEAKRLAPPPKDGLSVVESDYDLAAAEQEGLSSEQVQALREMRAENSGDAAFDKGALLPVSVRLYTAGAVDFNKKAEAPAAARFRAILDLPESDRKARATWAAYMLGRLYGSEGDVTKASEEFALTRRLSIEGAPDRLGLAAASYGAEARLYLERADSYVKVKKVSSQQWREYGRDIATAVDLYAQQAAQGSTSGVDSLRIVAGDLLGDEDKLNASISDPMVQRLMVGYVLAYNEAIPYSGAGNAEPSLLSAMQKHGLEDPAEADKLAALAYRSGDYHLAERLANTASGPLASWVRARLAMQKGNVAEAAKFYAEAAKAFPNAGDMSPSANTTVLIGEGGVLALSRGEYVDALEQLYPVAAAYWGDVAYIAERVLTVDELKKFVDTHVPSPNSPGPTPGAAGEESGNDQEAYWPGVQSNPAVQLRDLLARRLVRAGRYQEASAYFNAAGEVDEYASALHDAATGRSTTDRARGWYKASVLADKSGMKMMGYEATPDFYALGGEFDEGVGQTNPGNKLVTDGERQRFKDSEAKPNRRYHYRYIATDEAIHAADLLPPRSQAFAAVLCHATGVMMRSAEGESCPTSATELRASPRYDAAGGASAGEISCKLYQRYLQEGAVVPLATHFGRKCPEPDFVSAASFTQTQASREARRRHVMWRHRWVVVMQLAMIAVVLSVSTVWFLRHRYSAF